MYSFKYKMNHLLSSLEKVAVKIKGIIQLLQIN